MGKLARAEAEAKGTSKKEEKNDRQEIKLEGLGKKSRNDKGSLQEMAKNGCATQVSIYST